MMSERLENVVGDVIEEILRGETTVAEQVRFQGIMERMLASDSPADQYLSSSIMIQLADNAQAQYVAEEEGRVYSIYAIGRVGETAAFYIGASKDVQARYKKHLRNAGSVSERARQPVSARIHAEMNRDGVWCETWLSGLTKEMAQSLEATLITELVRGGAALENSNLRGEHGPPNRHPHGSPAYDVANRAANRAASLAHHHEHQATDPKYRSRRLAKDALQDLKKGRSLTPMRRHHIETAGRVEDARAILAARGEDWPGGTQV